MGVKITDNTPKVFSQERAKANVALRLMAAAVVRKSTPKTPKRDGDLRLNVVQQVVGLKAKIIWGMPYAEVQEETQFQNYTTPGTGPHYAENAVKEVYRESDTYFRQAGLRP